ncbi:MAG: M48 family metallopeptidase [Chloroflexota bacterium]|nr:M48 family metallopeptidase [Chloroflexota bacterium]
MSDGLDRMTPVTKVALDSERQERAREYARIRRRLLLADLGLAAAFVLAVLVGGLSSRLVSQIRAVVTWQPAVVALYTLTFFGVYGLLDLPLSFYGGFVLPHRYGLSTQTLGGWILDLVKGAALGGVIGLAAVEVMYWLLAAFPSTWWLLTGVLYLMFTVIMTNLAPLLIVPLFFKYTPLSNEELAQRLMRLADRAGTRVRGVFTINLSSRTPTANAALMGLGNTRRIVLGDTLLENYTADEIETILAHELGHHVHRDLVRGIVLQSALTLGGLYLASLGLRWGVQVFGFQGAADIAAFPLLMVVMGAFGIVTLPLNNAYSRWRESLADDYALAMTDKPEAVVTSMTKLANQNLSEVSPAPWVEFLLHSHPAIGRRIERAQAYAQGRVERV